MHIQPTKTDLRKGRPKNTRSCPLARAATRAYRKTFNTTPHIAIGDKFLVIYNKDNTTETYPLPKDAINFIHHFDTNTAFRAAVRKNYECREYARLLVNNGFDLPMVKQDE